MVTGEFRLNQNQLKKIEGTLAITMTMADWDELYEDLGNTYPAWKVKELIQKLLSSAHLALYETIESPK